MPTPLTGFPSGLLSLLGSNNFGEAPRQLSELVVPIVDCTNLYGLSRQLVPAVATFAFAVGPNTANSLQVPAREAWLIQRVSGFVTTAAGEASKVTINATYQGTGLAIGPTVVNGASETNFIRNDGPPFWLTAGGRINVFCHSLTGAPTVSLAVMMSWVNV